MKTQRLAVALLVAVGCLTLVAWRAEACAGCRNPSLGVTRGSEGALDAGATRLGASVTGTTVHVVHEAGCRDTSDCDEMPVQETYFHDQHLYPLELRLIGEYGLSETFGIEAQVPFRSVTTTIEYTDADGAHYEPLDPGVHHRDETVFGIADPWLLLRVGTTVQKWWLAARPGVSIPLGRTEENPFTLGDQGLRHQHIQLGSGTFDPVAVVEASRAFDALQLQFFAQGQVPFYENGHGYRASWRVYGGAAVGRKLVSELVGFGGVEASHEAAETWDGQTRQDGNLGRSELLLAAMLSQTFGTTMLSLSVRIPVWRQIVTGDEPPGTLSSPVVLSLSATHVFGGQQPAQPRHASRATR
ncbi:MAG TPA: hypothetical protein VJN18_02590 [Polyangiaceae bacterium]|nr:hypothetical protein [Polyangiaceae bacterium]